MCLVRGTGGGWRRWIRVEEGVTIWNGQGASPWYAELNVNEME
jgi:hypothetical protein